jgi:hypothetical protein
MTLSNPAPPPPRPEDERLYLEAFRAALALSLTRLNDDYEAWHTLIEPWHTDGQFLVAALVDCLLGVTEQLSEGHTEEYIQELLLGTAKAFNF